MFYQRGTCMCALKREDYCHHMTTSERDKRRFKIIECLLVSDVIPGKCSCWYLNLLFLFGNEMQCTQKTLWFLSWAAEFMSYGLRLTKMVNSTIMHMSRIAIFIPLWNQNSWKFWDPFTLDAKKIMKLY